MERAHRVFVSAENLELMSPRRDPAHRNPAGLLAEVAASALNAACEKKARFHDFDADATQSLGLHQAVASVRAFQRLASAAQ